MISIPIVNSNKCHEAAEWCKKEFEETKWTMWMTDFRGRYVFEFKRPEDAAWFALRWAE